MEHDPYARIAGRYDRLVEPLNRGLRRIGLAMSPPTRGMRVLDVGCGTGSHLELYRKEGCEVSGVDASPAMLGAAREKLGGEGNLVLGRGSATPFAAGTFDLVLAVMTLHETPPPEREAILAEARRVLANDGRMLLVDYHPGPLRVPKGWLYKVLNLFIESAAGREHFRNYRDFLRRGGLPPLMERHGLEAEKTITVSGGNIALVLARRSGR